MKRLWHPRFLIVAAFIGMIVLLACEDNVSESLQNNLKVSGDFLTGQVYFWDAYLIADKVARDSLFNAEGAARIDSAFCIMLPDDAGFSVQYELDGVRCPDGRWRQGTLLVTLDRVYLGDTLDGQISFMDYQVDQVLLDGELSFNGRRHPQDGQVELTLTVENGMLQEDSREIIWEGTQLAIWNSGIDTPFDLSDDSCTLMEGTSWSGTASNLIGYTASISKPLTFTRNCEYFTRGVITLQIPALEFSSGTMDFGDGECDGTLELEFGGARIPFYLD